MGLLRVTGIEVPSDHEEFLLADIKVGRRSQMANSGLISSQALTKIQNLCFEQMGSELDVSVTGGDWKPASGMTFQYERANHDLRFDVAKRLTSLMGFEAPDCLAIEPGQEKKLTGRTQVGGWLREVHATERAYDNGKMTFSIYNVDAYHREIGGSRRRLAHRQDGRRFFFSNAQVVAGEVLEIAVKNEGVSPVGQYDFAVVIVDGLVPPTGDKQVS